MAITHHFTVLCDYIMEDVNGSYTFAGTFTNLIFDEAPSVYRIGIAVGFSGEPDESVDLLVVLIAPDNTRIGSGRIHRRSDEEALVKRYDADVNTVDYSPTITFSDEGMYHLQVIEDGRIVHDRPFGVTFKNTKTEQQTEGETSHAST